tara:strand:+ start:677 stop:910 length:234 start_codon:yes stop_codon:yes gene_type:complete
MQDLLHDIKKLEEAKHHLILASGTTNKITTQADITKAVICISSLIEEKQKIVDEFEKQAPKGIQDLCNHIRGEKLWV